MRVGRSWLPSSLCPPTSGARPPRACLCLTWQWDAGRGWEALGIFGTAKELVVGFSQICIPIHLLLWACASKGGLFISKGGIWSLGLLASIPLWVHVIHHVNSS